MAKPFYSTPFSSTVYHKYSGINMSSLIALELSDGNSTESLNTSLPLCPEGESLPQKSLEARIALGIFLSAIVVLTSLGNVSVIRAVVRFRHMQSFTNTFVVSLAVADSLVGLIVMPIGIYQFMSNHVWELGSVACLLFTSFDIMFTTTSIFHLSCLAVDRYLAICKPFVYNIWVTKKNVSLALAVCWIVPCFISFLPIFNRWNVIGIEDIYSCASPKGAPVCIFIVNLPFALVCSGIAFYIPVIFVTWCNINIYIVARRQANKIKIISVVDFTSPQNGSNAERKKAHKVHFQHKHKKYIRTQTKAAKTLVIIMGVFSICWFPFFIINVADPFTGYSIGYYPWTIALWLGYINSTMNPFLFYFFNKKFRYALQIILPFFKRKSVDESGFSDLSHLSRRGSTISRYTQRGGNSSNNSSGSNSETLNILTCESNRNNNLLSVHDMRGLQAKLRQVEANRKYHETSVML